MKNKIVFIAGLFLLFFSLGNTVSASGAEWTKANISGPHSWKAIASSADGTKLAVVTSARLIYTSADSGATWTEQTGAGSRYWYSIASSVDGTKLAAASFGGYIYTSSDSGFTWTEQTGSGSRYWQSVASSADGTKLSAVVGFNGNGYIYTSADSGATWTEQTEAGSRSWTSITSSSDGTKLAAVGFGSYIYTSADSGATWTEQTEAGSRSWTSIASSSDGNKLAAAATNGSYIYTSIDSGVTWSTRSGAGSRHWNSIVSSADGTKVAAVEDCEIINNLTCHGGYIYTSVDSGANWEQHTGAGAHLWTSIASSADGTKLVIGDNMDQALGGYIQISTDSGTTWTSQDVIGSFSWYSVASSSDGTKLAAVARYGYIYTSADSGATWITQTAAGSRAWFSITSSADGAKLAATSDTYIYTSADSGATWTQQTNAGSHVWSSITSSADGTKLVATDGLANAGYIYTSTDSGATWTERTGIGIRNWTSITSSADGTKLAAVDINYIYTSTDSGATWTERTGPGFHHWNSIASSADGTKLAATCSGYIYTSTDSGVTWTAQIAAGWQPWSSITSSADGTKLATLISGNGYIHTSTDSGATWITQTAAGSRNWWAITSSADGTKLAAGEWGEGGIYFTTLAVLPKISNVSVTPTYTSVNITWTTDLPSDSAVVYGSASNYGSTESDSTETTEHSINLSNLTVCGAYHYQIRSLSSGSTPGYYSSTLDAILTLPEGPLGCNRVVSNSLILDADLTVHNLTINQGGTLDLNGYTLTISGDFVNNGTFIGGGGALVMSETGNLTLSTSLTLPSNLTIYNLSINQGGTLDLNGHTLTVTGNWSNQGTFIAHEGTVYFTGTNQSISGNNTFFNLTKTTSVADTLIFASSRTTTVEGALTLNGEEDNLLTLQSVGGTVNFMSSFNNGSDLNNPQRIAIDQAGHIYISDVKNHRIVKFNADGTFLSTIGSSGTGANQFNKPTGLAFDHDGNLYVADNGNNRIMKYDTNDTFLEGWGWGVADGTTQAAQKCTATCFKGIKGNGDGQFNNPHEIVFDTDNNMYVTNYYGNAANVNTVVKYSASGTFLGRWGKSNGTCGDAEGEFCYPDGIAIDATGNIYVVDTQHRIQKFDSNMNFIKMWGWGVQDGTNTFQFCSSGCTNGGDGSGDAQFDNPHTIAISPSGTIYIGDTGNYRIQMFDLDGNYLGQFGTEGSGEGQFEQPFGLAFNSEGNLLVVDGTNNNIQTFSLSALWNLDPQGSASASCLAVKDSNNLGSDITCFNCTNLEGNTGWNFVDSGSNPGSLAQQFRDDVISGIISIQGVDPTATTSVTFNVDYTITLGDIIVFIPRGTIMTKIGGGTLDLTSLSVDDLTTTLKSDYSSTIASAMSLGIPDLKLSFSQPITITLPIPTTYNSQTISIYYQNEGETTWTSGLSCTVESGLCIFQTDHATSYLAGETPVLAPISTSEQASIDSWSASTFPTPTTWCPTRLKLNIKGKHFSRDAEVQIGGRSASSVNKKSSKELSATFCLPKLLENQKNMQRKISVTNPDTDTETAKKQIDLSVYTTHVTPKTLPLGVIPKTKPLSTQPTIQTQDPTISTLAPTTLQPQPEAGLPREETPTPQTSTFIWWNPLTWW